MMTGDEKRKVLADWAEASEVELVLYDEYNEALVGVVTQFNRTFVVYDRERCLEILERDMTPEDAAEHFSFNTEGAWVGEATPGFLVRVETAAEYFPLDVEKEDG